MTTPAPIPPQNLDAEESVLGAMMLSPKAIDAVTETGLEPQDFYRDSHAVIYRAILMLYERGEPVDAISVTAELERADLMRLVAEGPTRPHELAAMVPAASNAAHYAMLVRRTATARGLVTVGNAMAALGQSGVGDEQEMIDRAEEAVFGLTQHRFPTEFVDLPTLYQAEFERMAHLHDGDGLVGTPTGYRSLDDLLGGLSGGQLVILAARPSMGKSAFALGIAANLIFRLGIDVALFSLEMSRAELTQRIMGMEARVDVSKIRRSILDAADWQRLVRLGGRVTAMERALVIDDNGAITLPEIRSKLRREKARRPQLGLIVLDYLQLMTHGAKIEHRVQEVSKISRGLKVLAREIDTPILALSQLNRGVESRPDKRPLLSDLRESGSIEQDADVVLFVYRDDYYHPDSADAGIAEIICAKNRNGPTGTVKLAFTKKYARFGELAHHTNEEG